MSKKYIPYHIDDRVVPTRTPYLLTIDKSHYRRIGYDEDFLIKEALRFFNHTSIKKRDNISKKNIESLRIKYHNILNERFKNLLCGACTNGLRFHMHKNKSRLISDKHAENGIYAVRTFLSANWRNAKAKGNVNLEDISPILTELRESINVKDIKDYLKKKYGKDIDINEPFWGGKYTIKPELDSGILKDEGNCYKGIFAHDTKDIGLTEKLDSMYRSKFFHETNQKGFKSTPMHRNGFEFLENIEREIDYINNHILPFKIYYINKWGKLNYRKKGGVWEKWFQRLDELAADYDAAIHVENEASPTIGVQVGLPWALVLIGVLKVYLIDLMLRTLMVSLPVYEVYKNRNGNAGIALIEALSGDQSLTDEQKCIDYNRGKGEEQFSSILKDWKNLTINNSLDDKNISELFKKMGKAPIIGPPQKNKKRIYYSIEKFLKKEVYSFPVVNENQSSEYNFYHMAGLNQRFKSTSLNFGIRYITQAHLYVAAQLLSKARQIVGLNDKKDDKGRDNFAFIASSLPWGGKFPPHSTHKDGRKVDIGFGPNLVRWPKLDFKAEKLATDILALLKGRDCSYKLNKIFKSYQTLLKISYERKNQEDRYIKNIDQIVSRELIRNLINKIKEDFINGKIAYDKVEKALMGTPHFSSSDHIDNIKMTHIAHLAILLSCPSEIIFASPIVHMRAIRALKEAYIDTIDPIFAFFPHNHHHHWHVEYVYKEEMAIKSFEKHFNLWMKLGIDFKPFIKYLKTIKKSEDIPHSGYSKNKELDELIKCLDNYNKNFKKDTNESNPSKLTKNLFSKYKYKGKDKKVNPFLQPTIKKEEGKYIQSGEMKNLIKKSDAFRRNINILNYKRILDYDQMIKRYGLNEDEFITASINSLKSSDYLLMR